MINDKYMDLINPKHISEYLHFKEGKRCKPFGNHQPVLIHMLNTIAEGSILEYGMGLYSTAVINMIGGMQGRKIVSLETDKKWFSKFLDYESQDHELILLPAEKLIENKHELFDRKYSIAFIDGASGTDRQKVIERIKDNVDYFIVHDTEEAAKNFTYPGFTYGWDFSGFKHQLHFGPEDPMTSVLSNLDEVDKKILDLTF